MHYFIQPPIKMKNSPQKSKRRQPAKIILPIAFSLFVLCSFIMSKPNRSTVLAHPLQRFSSDTLPKVELPKGVDPESEDWKGIDLGQKPPVTPLSPEEE